LSLDIITELRSAATTLRTPTGCVLPAQDRITAELLDRAADALKAAQVGRVVGGIAFGELLSADFEADTITLRMEPGYQVRAGRHGLFHMQGMQAQTAPPAAQAAPIAQVRPSWDDAPAWARFAAMDADGQWSWYENRPYPDTDLGSDEFTLWDADDGHIQPISSGLHFDGWENTLQERPAPTVSVTVAGAPLNAKQAAEALRKIEGDEVPR